MMSTLLVLMILTLLQADNMMLRRTLGRALVRPTCAQVTRLPLAAGANMTLVVSDADDTDAALPPALGVRRDPKCRPGARSRAGPWRHTCGCRGRPHRRYGRASAAGLWACGRQREGRAVWGTVAMLWGSLS